MKSQSMSTNECTKQSATASESASHARVRSRRENPDHGRGHDRRVEEEADDRRSRSGTAAAPSAARSSRAVEWRSTRSTSSNVPAPVPRSGLSVNAFHDFGPPAPAVARARADDPTRRLRHLRADLVRELVPALTDEIGGATGAHHRGPERDEHQDDKRNRSRPAATRGSTARENTKRDAKPTTIAPTSSTAPNTSPSRTRV